MIESDFRELEKLFFALADKTRLRLLALMADGEVAVGFLAERLGESQPKVSRHLAYLRGSGIVYTRRDGKWIYYGIAYPEDAALRRILETVVKSIAVMKVDGEYVYFTAADLYAEQVLPEKKNIYEQADMYRADEFNEEDTGIDPNDDILEDDLYSEPDAIVDDPDEMDIFLL